LRQGVVAVVDDDEAVLHSMKFLLETAGIPVAAYNSAAAFLSDGVDLAVCLIVDYHMPEMTGLELVVHLRRVSVPIPALLVTAFPLIEVIDRANRLGIKVLSKPVDPDDFLGFIEGASWRNFNN
jgi:two-component system response regulator FixJ